MRLNLSEKQINLLQEMLSGVKNIANETEDDVNLQYAIQLDKKLRRIGYTSFKNHQIEALWYLADSGVELAKKAEEDATSEEGKQAAQTVQTAYSQIKTDLENTVIANSPRKV